MFGKRVDLSSCGGVDLIHHICRCLTCSNGGTGELGLMGRRLIVLFLFVLSFSFLFAAAVGGGFICILLGYFIVGAHGVEGGSCLNCGGDFSLDLEEAVADDAAFTMLGPFVLW